MNNKIIFINDHWIWAVVAGAFVLMCVFIWKEFKSANKRRLILKLILSFFAIVSLAMIALKPALPASESVGKIILLTPGYENAQLDSLRKVHPGIDVLDYNLQIPLPDKIFEAEMVYIIGQGLPEYELNQFNEIPAVYIPGQTPRGVAKIHIPEKISIGDNFNISGLHQKSNAGNRLILQGPGGAGLDSVILGNNAQQGFKLSTELKVAGKFVYYLAEKDENGEILTKDPVPIIVEDKPGLRILVLNNFPTFETKYLKNVLAEAGHEVVVRSQITTGRYKYEYFNTGNVVIGNITEERLEPYDLLIIDSPTIGNLGGSQRDVIFSAIRNKGLGVFIQPDETFFSSRRLADYFNFDRQNRSQIQLDEWPGVKFSVLPYAIKPAKGFELIYPEGNMGISGYYRLGYGRIGTTVLSNTWQLVLEGKAKPYKELWSQLIAKVAKREIDSSQFIPQKKLVFPHEPLNFTIRTGFEKPEITNSTGSSISLLQDINFPDQWKGTVWPREEGWHRLTQDTLTGFDFYVFREGSWEALTSQYTSLKNKEFFDRSLAEVQRQFFLEPINPLLFYSLFLICMGGLWLEPKLS